MIDRAGSQIDHLNLAVPDLARSISFYTPVLATLGITTVLAIPARPDLPAMHGFGWAERKPFFWLVDGGTVGSNMHLAFTAVDRDEVRAFHEAALAAGAEELHQPGVWEGGVPPGLLRRVRPRPGRRQPRGGVSRGRI